MISAAVMRSICNSRARCKRKVMRVARRLCVLPGAPLHVILAAGEWRSPAFLKYLDLHSLERDMVIQAHADESDGEA